MKKIENCRTLCDYYNEIVYKVNQLTEMCGNTDEAIKLRDDIEDMFTVKFSEPLDEVSDLQEQIDCPFEVVVKAISNGIYVKDSLKENKINYIPTVTLSKVGTEFYLSNHCDFCVNVRDYKTLFWLKKDQSE